MNRRALWVSSVIVSLLLITAACASKTAPTAKATSPSPTVTSTAKPTASPTSAPPPTAKPITSAPAVSFAGKTITLIVPDSAGGGTDLLVRVIASFLPKYLPGSPTVVVRDVPGGGGSIASNLALQSRPDGLTILASSGTVQMAELLKHPAMKISLLEGTAVLGSVNGNIYYARPNLFDKPEDLTRVKGMVYGTNTGTTAMLFLISKEMIGIPTDKVILAYTGTGDARRAYLAGEINATSQGINGYVDIVLPLIQKGEMKVMMQTGSLDEKGSIVRIPIWKDYPTTVEVAEKVQGKAPTGLAYEAFRSILISSKALDKPLVLPPGTPDAIKRVFWDAAEKLLKDQEFMKSAAKVAGETKWMAGEAFNTQWHKEFGWRPEVRKWLEDLLRTKYGVTELGD